MTVKKTIYLFVISCFLNSAYGQQNKFDIGIEGGPSRIFLSGNSDLDNYNKPTMGFSAGIIFQYHYSGLISLRSGVSFERKGTSSDKTINDNDGNVISNIPVRSNFDYLVLPLLVRATIGNKINYFLNAGSYFGFLVKQTDLYENPKATINSTDLDKQFDWGITAGLGIIIPFKSKCLLSFEVRNNFGMFNVNGIYPNDSWTINTNSANLLIGLAYQIGKPAVETK